MKVLYLANGLPHYFNLVLSKLNSIPDLEILVVVPKGPGKYIGDGVFQSRQGINFRVLELREYPVGTAFAIFAGLPRLLFRERPDIVVLPEHLLLGFYLNPALVLARKLTGTRLILKSIPFLLLEYEAEIDRLSRNKPGSLLGRALQFLGIRRIIWRGLLELRRYAFRQIDAHVNYVDTAREIYGSYGVSQERIFVTRNSPDTDSMLEAETALLAGDNPPVRRLCSILHVGRLVQQKRVDLLLIAFQKVAAKLPDATLVIVGDGPERAEYERQAGNLGIAGSVQFAGPVYEREELARYFLSASVFALPGLGGLSINEAMFYGLAIVCASGDGTERFLVREGSNGAFFPEDDAASLAQVLIKVLSDPGKLIVMGQQSKKIIEHEVNIHTVVSGYLKAFKYAVSHY